jgi:hypothetical protein
LEPSNPAPEAQRSARRRLVRGAFAAPAVLALYSGSAAAMASHLRCVNNQMVAGQRIFPGPEATPDHFVRVRLWSLRSNDSARWFLRGNDFQALTMDSPSVFNTFLGPGEWREFSPQTQLLVGEKQISQPEPGELAHDGAWVAVRIDASPQGANIVGVVDRLDFNGSAVTGLCWTSFVTGARRA